MIITTSKPFEEVLKELEGKDKVFIVGCGSCAATCETGGEPEVAAMKEKLEAEGKTVTGGIVYEEVCHELNTKRKFRENKEATEGADAFLVMCCGAGCQSVREATEKTVRARLRHHVPGQHPAPGQLQREVLPLRGVRAGRLRRHLPGHPLPQGHPQRPLRRHRQRQVRDRQGQGLRLDPHLPAAGEGRQAGELSARSTGRKNWQASMKPGRVVFEKKGAEE